MATVRFSAYTEVDVPLSSTGPSEAEFDMLIDATADYSGSWAVTSAGNLAAQLSLDADSLRQAITTADLVVRDAVSRAGYRSMTTVRIEGCTEEQFLRRLEMPTVPELVSASEASKILGISKTALLRNAERRGGVRVGTAWVFPQIAVETQASRNRA